MPNGRDVRVASVSTPVLSRAFFDRPATTVAPELLGRVVEHQTPEGLVAVRVTEVEAYMGDTDPASHAYRGRTRRNATMFGEPGHVYVYFTYGMHWCMNLVCQGTGTASGVLLRAGEVVEGERLVRLRRPGVSERDWARGPARLTRALAVDRPLDGADACAPTSPLRVRQGTPVPGSSVCSSPRTGVAAAPDVHWRFYVSGERSVSRYRPHKPRARRS